MQTVLRTLAEYDALLQRPRVLLFKHSPTCPISAAARAHYERFREAHHDACTAFVDVIADRSVARGLAARCGVRHESPQAILFEGGAPVWHRSHGAITAAALAAAWAQQP